MSHIDSSPTKNKMGVNGIQSAQNKNPWLRWSIQRKLAFTYGLVFLLIAIRFIFGWGVTQNTNAEIDKLGDDLLLEVNALAETRAEALTALSETREYLLTGEDETLEELEESLTSLSTSVVALATAGESVENEAESDDEATLIENLTVTIEDLQTAIENAVISYDERLADAELDEILQAVETAENNVELALDAWQDALAEEQTDIFTAVRSSNRRELVSNLLLLLVFAPGIFGFSFFAMRRTLQLPLENLSKTAARIASGDLSVRAAVVNLDELGFLTQQFNATVQSMEQLVTQNQRTARYLKLVDDVTRDINRTHMQDEFLDIAAEKIRDTLDLYHVQIYILDEARADLVLRASTGEAGAVLLQQEHSVEMGRGLVGRTAVSETAVFVPDVSQDANWLANPLLPETCAEAVVPILFDNQLIGVLDMQDNVVGELDQDIVEPLQSIASSLAVAWQNARQVQETVASESFNRVILESITVPMLISRVTDGKLLYSNERLAEIIRLPLEELQEKGTLDFYNDKADRQVIVTKIQQQGFVRNYELRLKRADGEQFWSLLSAQLITFANEPAVITTLIDITERKVTEATLAQQANALMAVAEVGTATTTILQPEQLLQQAVDLTKERFELYHTHIFLLNENKDKLVLTAGAGDVGRKMVAEGRQIPLRAPRSLVASVARERRAAVRNYTDGGEGFMPHPLLLDTRSEMAVPILLGDALLGVLDVRSEQQDYFSEADMQTHTTLAAQVAVALQNARSFTRSEQAVEELQALSRRLTREGWEAYLQQRQETLAFRYDGQQVAAHTDVALPKTAVASQDTQLIAHPLTIQGEPIGKLQLATLDQQDEDASEVVTAVAERLSIHLENLRLAELSEQARADAEKRSQEMVIINSIVTQISASLDLQHSLQIIVDELVTAVDVDQVRVALLQPDKTELLVIAEHYDSLRSTSALGMTIPVLGNELTEAVITTRQMAVIEDAQSNPRTEPVHEMFRAQGIETVILMPLVVNDEVLGTIGMDILDKRPVPQGNLKLAETIVYQAATAVQNARLFEQTQAALAETEMLYAYSSQLNTATSLDAVLDSAAAAGFQVGATHAVLLINEQSGDLPADYGQIVAATATPNGSGGRPLPVPGEALRNLWPDSGKNIVFVGDIGQDARLSEADKAAFHNMDIHALAVMFLIVGNLRLGQIVISWGNPQTFTNTDERLYGSIGQQASSVVYNRLLFNQTEEALSETAALYQASTDLNTAQTFAEVLTTLRQHTILGQSSNDVTLNYFNKPWDKANIPEEIEILTRWGTLPSVLPTRYKLSFFPEVETVLTPDECLICEDVATDERMSEKTRAIFSERFKAKSAIYVPLVVGGQWVGFISGIYPQSMQFPEAQVRRLNVLARQAVVSIQSIRLYEQTQLALAETEALYSGSENLVLSNSEDDILHALVDSTLLQNMDRANLFMFDQPVEDRIPQDVTAVAIWTNEGVPTSIEVGTRFQVAQVPFMAQLRPDTPMFIEDVQADERVDKQTAQILQSFGMRSFILYPLVVGNQWLGLVSGQAAQPTSVDEGKMRRSVSLVGQAAVVMQTTQLFRHEQARASREHLLREIATKVRSSTDVDTIMRTAVTEIGRTLGRRSFIKLGNGNDENGVA